MPFVIQSTAYSSAGSAAATATISANVGDTIAVVWYGASGSAGTGTITDSGGNTYTIGNNNSSGSNLWGSGYCLTLTNSITSVTYAPPAPIGVAILFVWRITFTGGVLQFADSKAPAVITSTTGTNAISSGSMNVTTTDGLLLSACFNATVSALSAGTVPAMVSDGYFIANSALAEHFATTSANPATFTDSTAGDTLYLGALAFQVQSPIVQSAASPFSSADPWSGGQVSVTLSGVTAGNAIVIATPALINTSGSPSLTISDTVNSVTELKQIASFGLSSVYAILDFSIIPNASAGSHTLTAAVGSGTGYGFIVAAEISGLNASAALDVFSLNATAGGSNPSTGNSGIPASASEVAIAAVSSYYNGASLAIGEPLGYANVSKYQGGGGYVQYSVDYLTPLALAPQSASWTGLTAVNSYAAGVIVLKAAANQAVVMWWS